MAKIELKYVDMRIRRGRVYYYFRKRGMKLVPLPGVPGSEEFSAAYEACLAAHAPRTLHKVRQGERTAVGTLGWAIREYKSPDNPPWKRLGDSSKAVYLRAFDWLEDNHGTVLLSAFDQDMMRAIRDERAASPSVANLTVDKFGQIWSWAKEFRTAELRGPFKLPAISPTFGVKSLDTEGKPAPAWPAELCAAMEQHPSRAMVTFYYLARYTGQRRGDCCDMEWAHYNERTGKIFVMQEKTNTRVWVPAHRRLREYLATVPRTTTRKGVEQDNTHILTSQYGRKFAATGVTNRIIEITRDDLGFKDEDGDVYSPHGLRHACGAALAEAGCSAQEIMSILGHLTERQANHYVAQANRNRLGEVAMGRWEQHDDKAVPALGETKISTLSERRRRKAAA